jgi:hypothetical protein
MQPSMEIVRGAGVEEHVRKGSHAYVRPAQPSPAFQARRT